MTTSDDLYQQFERDAERVRRLLELLARFKKFAGSQSQTTPGHADPWPQATELAEFAAAVRTDLPLSAGSLLLYSVGRFEHFVRALAENAATEYAAAAAKFSDLPESTQKAIRASTLDLAKSPSKYNLDLQQADAVLIAFTSVIVESLPVAKLRSEVISFTDANMRPSLLAEVLGRVDVKDYWKELSKQSPMKLYLGVVTEDSCLKGAKAELETIMDTRNQLAHPTGDTTFPDADQVRRHVDFLVKLASVTALIVDVRLAGGLAPTSL